MLRSASALMSAPAAKIRSEPAITMQRTSGSESSRLSSDSSRPFISAERALRVSGLLRRSRPTWNSSTVVSRISAKGASQLSSNGSIALIPVAARPMISFWICEVPSYRVVTRASRR